VKDVRMIDIDVILLVGAVVLIAAIIAARIGARIGLPALLLFLGLGMVMGDSGIGIPFDNAELAQGLGFAALVVILAEGGLTTKWSDIRSSTALAVLLATLGIGISVGLMTLFGHFVLGLPIWIAMLLGAVTSPTDAAAIFSVLRNVPIPSSLRGALEAESGLNDAPSVLLVMLASSLAVGGPMELGILGLLGLIVLELLGGLLIGGGLGWVGAQILRRVALPSSGLYPLAILGWIVWHFGSRSCQRVRDGLRVRANPRKRPVAPPGGDPLLCGRDRLDRPDRPLRHARPTGVPGPGDASCGTNCAHGRSLSDSCRPARHGFRVCGVV
jgi:potassium/hydrogen antiporter